MPYFPLSKYLLSLIWMLPFLAVTSLFDTQLGAAQSQITVEAEILDSSVSAEDREKLLARLSDKEVRDIVWNLIQTNSKSQETDNPLAAELSQLTSNLRSNFDKRIQHIPKLLALPSLLVEAITPPGRRKRIFRDRLLSWSHWSFYLDGRVNTSVKE